MRIGKPELVQAGPEIQLRAMVDWEGQREHLWYAVDKRYAEFLTNDKLDAFVVGMLLPAMAAREDIHVEGPMSEKLYWNLTNFYMHIMASLNPTLHPVRIVPATLDNTVGKPEPAGVVTGFSAGIDSFTVLADHFFKETVPTYKITHLIYTNVGSHGTGGRDLFLKRYERLSPCAKTLGLPFIRIDSNLSDFCRMRFGHSHTPRNISAVLALQGLFAKYHYASSYGYEDCHLKNAMFIGYAEPLMVHLLSTETIECAFTGGRYSRVEKTAIVSEIPASYGYLDVCAKGIGSRLAGNCSVCRKCTRTLMTLELLGKEHLYDKVFDLQAYRRVRSRALRKMLMSKKPMLREISSLARDKGYTFPLGLKLNVVNRRARYFVKDILTSRHLLSRR